MQKSFFSKYFTVCASISLSSIVILGLIFSVFISQYFKTEEYQLLTTNAERGAKAIVDRYKKSNTVDSEHMSFFFGAMSESIGTTFFVTDGSGGIIFCTEKQPCSHMGIRVGTDIISQIRNGEKYAEMGTFNQLYQDHNYTIGVPIKLEDNAILGYVFASSDVGVQQGDLVNELIKMFLISSVAVLIITFIAVYFVSLKMAQPLRQMAEAATRFGKGEFSTRIDVVSEDETGQLATAMNNMAQSLSISENTRRSFIANISHELKTPMTSISGFIDGILDGTIPKENENYYLSIVSEETKRLSRLVRTMLNLSRIEAGEMKITKISFDVVDTICRTVFSFEQQIDKKHLAIKGLDIEKVMIDADKDLVHQVIYNLTENAVKFANEDGYIEFNITSDQQYIYIAIKNSGTGLSKEEMPKLFDRFYKTDKSRGLDKNGVGLGLYIVRSVINLHGGDIIVRSVEGEYSEFVFSIPVANQAPKFKKNS